MTKNFYLLPLIRRGQGSGHLRRCWTLAQSLGPRAALVLDEAQEESKKISEWVKEIPGFPAEVTVLPLPPSSQEQEGDEAFLPSWVLFDQRSSTFAQLEPWLDRACPVLLDDNGPARAFAPFVLDALPGPRRGEANRSSLVNLNLPPRRRKPDPQGPLLVSFGGEDPAGLTLPTVKALIEKARIPPDRITVCLPAGTDRSSLPAQITILHAPQDLKKHLSQYGLVITSYGLSAWEAIAAGSAVLTIEPGSYHARLARLAGFPSIGKVVKRLGLSSDRGLEEIPPRSLRRLLRFLENPEKIVEATLPLQKKIDPQNAEKLDFTRLACPRPRCLACGKAFPPIIARFPHRSYYRCLGCGLMGLYRFSLPDKEYGPQYFQEEYRAQYGRSYLEDWENIKNLSQPRLGLIRQKIPQGGQVLDIGCAFGPFLQAAAEKGFIPHGTDVSPQAIKHVRQVLGYPATVSSFPDDFSDDFFEGKSFDVLTLWYVIEHFPRLDRVLSLLNKRLRLGGVLAFSTPHAQGISARKNKRLFLENSPHDHYSLWTARTARRLLAHWGFHVYHIRVTGHHPERFYSPLRPGGWGFPCFAYGSRLLRLGDTFEVYAMKTKNCD